MRPFALYEKSILSVLKLKETGYLYDMGERNGTVVSKQALNKTPRHRPVSGPGRGMGMGLGPVILGGPEAP